MSGNPRAPRNRRRARSETRTAVCRVPPPHAGRASSVDSAATQPGADDLAIELDGTDTRAFGSRGEQRLLALALRLAEVLPVTEAAGTAPVLLLDDALSELDGVVGGNVLREIQSVEQVFLTSPEPLAVHGAARWIVESGEVSAA